MSDYCRDWITYHRPRPPHMKNKRIRPSRNIILAAVALVAPACVWYASVVGPDPRLLYLATVAGAVLLPPILVIIAIRQKRKTTAMNLAGTDWQQAFENLAARIRLGGIQVEEKEEK